MDSFPMNVLSIYISVMMAVIASVPHAFSETIIQTSPGTLKVTVSPFSVNSLRFPGGEITALPSQDQVLVLNLRTLRLHVLPRSLGDGELPLARIDSLTDSILKCDPIPLKSPVTRIPRSLEKLSKGVPLHIVCLGTSLVENGTLLNGWQRLLFPESFEPAPAGSPKPPGAEFASLLRIPGKIVSVSNAVGGSNSRYTFALIGEGREDGRALASTVFDNDLAIVALLPNGGPDRKAVYEGVVRRLRAHGLEVLLLTDNAFAEKTPDGLWTDGEFVRQLADRYGCGLADTAAYMREGELLREKVYRDSIHQADQGQIRWAEAIAGVLAPNLQPIPAEPIMAASSTLEPAAKVPDASLVEFTPVSVGSVVPNESSDNRPARVYLATKALRRDYPVGASLSFGDQSMMAADLVITAQCDFSAELRNEKGDLIRTVAQHQKTAEPPRWLRRPITLMLLTADDLSKPDSSKSYRLTVTEGTLQLYAVSLQQHAR